VDTAQPTDFVTITYKVTFPNGTLYAQQTADNPLVFQVGNNPFFPWLDSLVTGLQIGESCIKTLPAGQAFGPPSPDLIQDIPLENVPTHVKKEPSQRVYIEPEHHAPIHATITHVTDTHLTLDGNCRVTTSDMLVKLTVLDIAAAH